MTRARTQAGGPSRSDTVSGWSFLVPFLLIYLVFLLFPVLQAVFMGFFEWDLLDITDQTFIGLEHYGRMMWGDGLTWDLTHLLAWRVAAFAGLGWAWMRARRGAMSRSMLLTLAAVVVVVAGGLLGIHPGETGRWYDSQFWPSFGNTLLFVLMSTPLIVGLGLALAIALNRPGRLVGVLRTLFFAPYVLSVAVLTLIWAFLLNPQLGLIGELWSFLGQTPVNWLNSSTWAMPAIVVTTLWWTVGFNIVLFLAGLQDIDETQYEAASLDGATSLQKFRYITIPGLRSTILLVTILQVIQSFQIFGQVFIMTRGGPNGATRVVIQHIFESGFRDAELGYASAMSLVLFLVMISISVVQFRFLGEDSP